MSNLTFSLPEEKAQRLSEAAREMGVAVEDLLRRIADDYLDRRESFEAAAQFVLRKNAELYRRLAQ